MSEWDDEWMNGWLDEENIIVRPFILTNDCRGVFARICESQVTARLCMDYVQYIFMYFKST